jgi:hypothetical protein
MEQQKLLFSKLRQPVHFTYIAKYILKVEESEALQILENYVKSGEIMESPLSKGYYQINDKNLS